MSLRDDFKSPLHQMALTTPTDFWNDSCAVEDLTYAIDHGAVGATSNPTIIVAALKKEMRLWDARIREIIAQNPTASEIEIGWQIFEEVAVHGSRLLLPVFERTGGGKGRLSIQTNPANYRNADAIIEQARRFHTLAPNLHVKIPATAAGIAAIEAATYQGISITATVSFTVAQAVAIAEAVERGLARRATEGKPIDHLHPICVIMVGRVDDWMQAVVTRDNLTLHPSSIPWAGVAVMKKVYGIFQTRGYRARLLVAAYRHHLHWSEFMGGDLIVSIPPDWQKRFNASDVPIAPRIDVPVDPAVINDLYSHLPEFRKAYDEEGLTTSEFDTYGATVRTLRAFIASYHELLALVRENFMLPNPDVR
jgi:transaldolase